METISIETYSSSDKEKNISDTSEANKKMSIDTDTIIEPITTQGAIKKQINLSGFASNMKPISIRKLNMVVQQLVRMIVKK